MERRQHDAEPAAHAVAEAADDAVRDVAELEALQQVAAALLPVVHPAQPRAELEVLPRRGPRDEAADVGAVADGPLDAERVGGGVVAGDASPSPAVGGHDARQHLHGRRLARAVAPEQRGRAAAVGGQVDARDGLDVAEAHVQVADDDGGGDGWITDLSPSRRARPAKRPGMVRRSAHASRGGRTMEESG